MLPATFNPQLLMSTGVQVGEQVSPRRKSSSGFYHGRRDGKGKGMAGHGTAAM
jgi:hypothetical protein